MNKKKSSPGKTANGHAGIELTDVPVLVQPPTAERTVLAKTGPYDSGGESVPSAFSERELLRVLTEVRNGNFRVRLPIDQVGLQGKICDTLNEIIALNERMMEEFTRA